MSAFRPRESWCHHLCRAVCPDRAALVVAAVTQVLDENPSAVPWLDDDTTLAAMLHEALADLGDLPQPMPGDPGIRIGAGR